MIDKPQRAEPQFSSPEEIAAWYTNIQQQAADNMAQPRDPWDVLHERLREVVLQRLRGEDPDVDWMIHWELAGDIAKDVRNALRDWAG